MLFVCAVRWVPQEGDSEAESWVRGLLEHVIGISKFRRKGGKQDWDREKLS